LHAFATDFRDPSTHGKTFMQTMDEVNEITVTHSLISANIHDF